MIFAKAIIHSDELKFSVGTFTTTRKIRVHFTDANNKSAKAYALLIALREARREFFYSFRKDEWRKYDDIFNGMFYVTFSGDYSGSVGRVI